MNAICKYRGHTYRENDKYLTCTICGEQAKDTEDPFVKEGLKYIPPPRI